MRDTASSITSRMAGDIFKPPNFMQQRENYMGHGVVGMRNRADEQATAFNADAKVQGFGLQAAGTVAAAEARAEATVAAAQAGAQADMVGAGASALGSIFGGLNFGGSGGGGSYASTSTPMTSGLDFSSAFNSGGYGYLG
jgi:hypothetical protein